jgi:hypothetical protein
MVAANELESLEVIANLIFVVIVYSYEPVAPAVIAV